MKEVPLAGLAPDEVTEALNEAKLLRRLCHPNIVEFIDAYQRDKCLIIITGLAHGGDLAGLIQKHRSRSKPVAEADVWSIFIQVVKGLDYLHDRRILHRDLKPGNVLLERVARDGAAVGRVMIGDLGFGRVLAPHEQWATSGVGTPIYFAPELCQGSPYDGRVDVWALGCIVHELATLSPPFDAASFMELATKIMGRSPKPIPAGYSIELQFLVSQMIEKDPKRRPVTRQLLAFPAVLVRIELETTHARHGELALKLADAEHEATLLRRRLNGAAPESTDPRGGLQLGNNPAHRCGGKVPTVSELAPTQRGIAAAAETLPSTPGRVVVAGGSPAKRQPTDLPPAPPCHPVSTVPSPHALRLADLDATLSGLKRQLDEQLGDALDKPRTPRPNGRTKTSKEIATEPAKALRFDPCWTPPRRPRVTADTTPSPTTHGPSRTITLTVRRGLQLEGSPPRTKKKKKKKVTSGTPHNSPPRPSIGWSPGRLGPPLRVPRSHPAA